MSLVESIPLREITVGTRIIGFQNPEEIDQLIANIRVDKINKFKELHPDDPEPGVYKTGRPYPVTGSLNGSVPSKLVTAKWAGFELVAIEPIHLPLANNGDIFEDSITVFLAKMGLFSSGIGHRGDAGALVGVFIRNRFLDHLSPVAPIAQIITTGLTNLKLQQLKEQIKVTRTLHWESQTKILIAQEE